MLAISEAVCRHRAAEGIDGPLFLGRDTHALSEPATRTIVEVLGAHGVDVVLDADDGADADAGDLARDPDPQPRRRPRHGRRHRRHPVAQPARRRRLQVQPAAAAARPTPTSPAGIEDAANALLEAGLDGVKRVAYESAGGAPPRLRHRLRRRPRRGDRPRRDPRRRASSSASTRSAARACATGSAIAERRRPRPRDRQRRARPDLPLRAARLGRQDPHGLLLALRDGAPDRPQGPLRRRLRQRPRRRPPRHRHAVRGAAEPQPPPRRLRRLPVRRAVASGGRTSASARRS